jgi:inorganic triphosphatase YgiF
MEIELRFLVEEEFTRDRIMNDGHLLSMAENEEPEVIPMKAIYLDTEDQAMLRKSMAFRVRYEDGRPVATLKWGGKSENGLHERGELNVSVDEEYVKEPHMNIFKGSEIYEEIAELVGDKPLMPVMEMEFIRKQIHVDTGKSISVVSYDEGEIRTTGGNAEISEMEVELYSGSQDDMIALGRELAAKYNLKAGEKSKFQRGIELLGI